MICPSGGFDVVQQAAQGAPKSVIQHRRMQCGAGETGSASSQVLFAALSLSSDFELPEVDKFLNSVRAA